MPREITSIGLQIHGGMGFIEETGAAQHFRDAKITTIYEGTTSIQGPMTWLEEKFLKIGAGFSEIYYRT
ncbi:MAG: hypothetical protein Ct9H300mP4_17840 [Gammaproteobacteria bacterium]|nr:MAG: hypothetical protein Ct9H300mP4_17840 [Gammaproteobacteria bacterium]